MNTQEIKRTISELSPDELMQFSKWFEEFIADHWDKKIKTDILSGRLDTVGQYVDNEFDSGRANPLS